MLDAMGSYRSLTVLAFIVLSSSCGKDSPEDGIVAMGEMLVALGEMFPDDPDHVAMEQAISSVAFALSGAFGEERVTPDGMMLPPVERFPVAVEPVCTRGGGAHDARWIELGLNTSSRPGQKLCYRSTADGRAFSVWVVARVAAEGIEAAWCRRGHLDRAGRPVIPAEAKRIAPDEGCDPTP